MTKINQDNYEVIGIGFGPANIALAIALEELMPRVRVKFLEKRSQSIWQPEMLINRSDIQNHPLRDLVTPRNPRSKYTFVNYLHEKNRLFEYLNLGIAFPLRKEYSDYISWVAKQFEHWVAYNQQVETIKIIRTKKEKISGYTVTTKSSKTYNAKILVVAPGRTPYIPQPFNKVNSDQIFHLTSYLSRIKNWQQKEHPRRIAVIGGSQSAVELILDLSRKFPKTEIIGILRSFGYRLKDTSPFTGEVYFPSFINYYYQLDQKSKEQLNTDLNYTNYSSVDGDVLSDLYLKIYEQKLDGDQKIFIKKNSQVTDINLVDQQVALTITEKYLKELEIYSFDLVILATGFRNFGLKESEERYPPILENINDHLQMNKYNYLHVNYDYSLNLLNAEESHPSLFLNGLCEASHGMGDAGSFSLLSLRSARIVNALKDHLGSSKNNIEYNTSSIVNRI